MPNLAQLKTGTQILIADGSVGTIKHIGYDLLLGRDWKHFPQLTKRQIHDLTVTRIINYSDSNDNNNNDNNKHTKQDSDKKLLHLRQGIGTWRQVVVVVVQLNRQTQNYQSAHCPNLSEIFENIPPNLYFSTLDNLQLANYRDNTLYDYTLNKRNGLKEYPSPRGKHAIDKNLIIGSMVRVSNTRNDDINNNRLAKIVDINAKKQTCGIEFDNHSMIKNAKLNYHIDRLSSADEIICNVDESLLNAPCIDKLPSKGSIVQTRENEWGIVRFSGQILSDSPELSVGGLVSFPQWNSKKPNSDPIDYVGIEMRYWNPNCGDGSFDGWKYFNCQMGYSRFVKKDFIIDQYNWKMERIIWIGYQKENYQNIGQLQPNSNHDQKCFFSLLAKCIVRHILSFVNYAYIVERFK